MGYADLAAVQAQLHLDDEDADHASDIALLAACDTAVSLAFEQKAGYDVTRSPIWGDGVTADEVTLTVEPRPRDGVLLFLPKPLRSISEIRIGGALEETLAATDWRVWNRTVTGDIHQVRRIDGAVWPFADGDTWIEVDGVASDGPVGETVPELVTQAINFLVVDEYLMRKSSPAGELGPEGLTFRPRNPWRFELVLQALAAHSAPAPLPVF
jgi:hypothetical protein